MSWAVELLILAVCLGFLLVAGVWTAFALLGAGMIILAIQGGNLNLQGVGAAAFNGDNNFLLSAIPLFIFMGQIILASGVSERFFRSLCRILRGVPGELLPGSILACGVFAATTGSSVATAAAVGSVALPEMKRRGYNTTFAGATIAAGGTLGILVPPSGALIIYSSLENVSITRLFTAGLFPALLMGLLFIAYTIIRVMFTPTLISKDQSPKTIGFRATVKLWSELLMNVVPVLALIFLVLGSIYGGFATPAEAGSLGVLGALVISFRHLTFRNLYRGARRAIEITVMLFAIILGGQIVSYALVGTGIAQSAASFAVRQHVSSVELLIILCVLFVFLGDFVEGIGLMLITVPVFFPIFMQNGFNPYLLGVLFAILIELGQITPPVGLNLFILRGFEGSITQTGIVKAALPYAGIMLVVFVIIAAFPPIATWLPSHVTII